MFFHHWFPSHVLPLLSFLAVLWQSSVLLLKQYWHLSFSEYPGTIQLQHGHTFFCKKCASETSTKVNNTCTFASSSCKHNYLLCLEIKMIHHILIANVKPHVPSKQLLSCFFLTILTAAIPGYRHASPGLLSTLVDNHTHSDPFLVHLTTHQSVVFSK